MRIKFQRLDKMAIEPERGSEKAACYDLFALEDVHFGPGDIKLVKTGWACEVPAGYRTSIYVRSSTPLKKRFILANGVGIIDNDYRGELKVQLMNVATANVFIKELHGFITVFDSSKIRKGDKIAQLEIVPDLAPNIEAEFVDELTETKRGSGGFGSTGN